ncbi:MAG: OmpA family protein [Dinghuibacter sp.]|nr:OmpA family protein [Dinghuibacter sp.]
MKRIFITASFLGVMLLPTRAQEFTIGFNGAQAGASYTLPNGSVLLKPSFGGEAGFQVRLGNHLKVLSGLEVFRYQSKATLTDNQVYAHNQVDDMGSAFEYRVTTTGYTETQTLSALRVPLMLQFTTGSLTKTQWYINAGGKFMLPAKVIINATASQLTTKGYYPDVHAEVHDLPQHGFGTVTNWQSKGSYSTKPGWLFSAATGFSFKLNHSGSTRLYAGVYTDYGISNLQNSSGPVSIITYNAQNVANVQANGSMGINGVTSIKYINYGIQVKLGFGHKQKTRKTNATMQPAPQAIPETKQAAKQDVKELPVQEPPVQHGLTAAEKNLAEQAVFFGRKNNIELNESIKQHLTAVAEVLNRYPNSRIVIKGHTCNLGTPAVNEKRSRQRATACADYLAGLGIARNRMQVQAMGTSEPAAPNTTEENREQNRRVTFTVTE